MDGNKFKLIFVKCCLSHDNINVVLKIICGQFRLSDNSIIKCSEMIKNHIKKLLNELREQNYPTNKDQLKKNIIMINKKVSEKIIAILTVKYGNKKRLTKKRIKYNENLEKQERENIGTGRKKYKSEPDNLTRGRLQQNTCRRPNAPHDGSQRYRQDQNPNYPDRDDSGDYVSGGDDNSDPDEMLENPMSACDYAPAYAQISLDPKSKSFRSNDLYGENFGSFCVSEEDEEDTNSNLYNISGSPFFRDSDSNKKNYNSKHVDPREYGNHSEPNNKHRRQSNKNNGYDEEQSRSSSKSSYMPHIQQRNQQRNQQSDQNQNIPYQPRQIRTSDRTENKDDVMKRYDMLMSQRNMYGGKITRSETPDFTDAGDGEFVKEKKLLRAQQLQNEMNYNNDNQNDGQSDEYSSDGHNYDNSYGDSGNIIDEESEENIYQSLLGKGAPSNNKNSHSNRSNRTRNNNNHDDMDNMDDRNTKYNRNNNRQKDPYSYNPRNY
jgi:hypothetical protein